MPRAWTRSSYVSFLLLSVILLLFGGYFLAAKLAPEARVVVRSCHERHDGPPGQECAVDYREYGGARLVDVETDRLYPEGEFLTVHVRGPDELVLAQQADSGLLFLPAGLLGLLLLRRLGWPARR